MFGLNRYLAIAAISLCGAFALNAQQTAPPTNPPERAGDVTVFGCLVQGDQAGQYVIKGTDRTYVVKGHSKDLAKHLNHMVSVSGSMRPATTSGSPDEIERFKVSSVAKTHETCP